MHYTLLDTGAQGSMVSQKTVDEAGLQTVGYSPILPVTGQPFQTKRYRVYLDIPVGSAGGGIDLREKDMDVSLLPYAPANHDVLFGIDFISGLHLTVFGESYVLSI